MQIPDSRIGFDNGMHKVVSPAQTFATALRRLSRHRPRLLERYVRVSRPSHIPQTRFEGTDAFRKAVKANGTNGKGHDWNQAHASGIMEFVERYSCLRFLSRTSSFCWAPLQGEPGNPFGGDRIYGQCLPGMHECVPVDKELGRIPVRWYRGMSLDGKPVRIPTAMMLFLMQGSNGMASGNSLAEALVQGICEVMERHCTALIGLNRRPLPEIAPDSVSSNVARRLLGKYRAMGQEVLLRDCSLDLGIPAIGAVRRINRQECVFTIGVAADPDEALIRALTENSQAEGRLMNVPVTSCAYLFAAESIPKKQMSEMPCVSDSSLGIVLRRLDDLLAARGMRIFFHRTEDAKLRIPSAIAVVSGAKCFNPLTSRRNIYLAILEEYMQSRRFPQAQVLIRRFRRIDPRNANAYDYYRAVLMMQLGQYASGVRQLERTGDIPGLPLMTNASLALQGCYYGCLSGKPDWETAGNRLIRLLRRDPDFRFELSWVYHRLRPFRDAETRKRLTMMRVLVERLRSLTCFYDQQVHEYLAAGKEQACLPW